MAATSDVAAWTREVRQGTYRETTMSALNR